MSICQQSGCAKKSFGKRFCPSCFQSAGSSICESNGCDVKCVKRFCQKCYTAFKQTTICYECQKPGDGRVCTECRSNWTPCRECRVPCPRSFCNKCFDTVPECDIDGCVRPCLMDSKLCQSHCPKHKCKSCSDLIPETFKFCLVCRAEVFFLYFLVQIVYCLFYFCVCCVFT